MIYDRAAGWLSGFEGVVSAVVTPFDERSRVDPDAIGRLAELQVAGGVPAVMIGGTTGEFVTMAEAERRETVERFMAALAGRVRVIVNVGHVDSWQAHRLAQHAVEQGVDAVAAIVPYFHPITPRAVERYFRDLARSVPETAFLVYDFPRNTTNTLLPEAFGRLLAEPNVCGAKCSIATMAELEPYLEFQQEVPIMSGNDRLFEPFVAAGGRAVVSGNAAAYPELIVHAFRRCLDGAWNDQDAQLVDDIATAGRNGAPDRLKELLTARGVSGGAPRVRTHLPEDVLRDRNDEAARRVKQTLDAFTSLAG